jgi:hypothetical protein
VSYASRGAGGAALLLSVVFLSSPAVPSPLAQACTWDSAVRVGELDSSLIDEASGLAVSSEFPNRLYHINDSGDSGRFYITGFNGGGTQTVNVDLFDPRDAEDIALGPCGSLEGSCLFIADIGDNARVRDELEIVLIQEQEQFSDRTSPVDSIRIKYPDGAHDAESIAVHPNGDLFIVSKGADYSLLTVSPSRIYRLPGERWQGADGSVQQLDLLGEVDFTAISSDTFSGSLPTAFDISDDGQRFIVMTYVNAFEFYIDLSRAGLPVTEDLVPGVDFREITLEVLDQQESIAYLGENALLYGTEAVRGEAPIMRVRCRTQ